MELGLLSNMLVNSELYWQAYVPPLFSAIAGDRTNVRIVEPPPVAWSRCAEWKLVRSRVKACDTLFWLQLSARPAPQIHLASLSRLGARRANFVIDAWKPVLTKIGVAATIERLDPCFIAYLEATTELKRRFPLAKFVWLPHAGNTDIFYPRTDGKPNLAFYMGRRHAPLHQALLNIAKREVSSISIPIASCSARNSGVRRPALEYFVASPREVLDPKTRTASARSRRGISRGWRRERACSALCPRAASTTPFCRPTPCVKCRSTVRISPNVSIGIDKIRTIDAQLTQPRPWCANIIPGVGAGSKSTSFSSMGARWIST